MKKKLLLLTMLLSVSMAACGSQEKPAVQSSGTESAVTESSVAESAATLNSETAEGSTAVELTSSEPIDYEQIILTMSELPEANDCSYHQTVTAMGNTLVGAKLLDHGRYLDFNNLDADELLRLNYNIIENAYYDNYFGVELPEYVPGESSVGYYKEDFENILHSFYKFDGEIYIDNNLLTEDNGVVHIMFADGDPWINFSGCSIKENYNYILLNAPCYYGDNGGAENVYKYNATILFEKNEESLFGLQIVYASAYKNSISISSAAATSQLPDSGSKTYSANNLIDQNYHTTWVENVPGTGAGQVITLHLDSEQPVQDVLLYNGYLESKHLYDANGKVTRAKVDFGSNCSAETDLFLYDYYGEDDAKLTECYPALISWGYPVMTDTITITIISACEGEKCSDTCISEIELH